MSYGFFGCGYELFVLSGDDGCECYFGVLALFGEVFYYGVGGVWLLVPWRPESEYDGFFVIDELFECG